MIANVIKPGDTLTKADLFRALLAQMAPQEPYRKQRAAASIGGAVKNRYLIRIGDDYICP